MKILPVITEKSLADSKDGKYSFWVPPTLTKTEIKKFISEAFGVHVKSVRTMSLIKMTKRNYMGKKRVVPAKKKAIVTLAEKEKIDIFEEKKK